MSGYSEQDTAAVYRPYADNDNRVIEQSIILMLLEASRQNPQGTAARFIIDAAAEGWKIDFERRANLVVDNDDLVGKMWVNINSDDPVIAAYGRLVAESLNISLGADG